MTEPTNTVTERITTTADGPTTVNERLSPGGPGPEGQPDTARERLSGAPAKTPAPEHAGDHSVAVRPSESAHKTAWVDYAVSMGDDRTAAEASTKAALIAKH